MYKTIIRFRQLKTSSANSGRSFFLPLIFLLLAGCTSSKFIIYDAVSLQNRKTVITSEYRSKNRFLLFSGGIIDFTGESIDLPGSAGIVKSLYFYNDTIFGIAEKGIVAIPKKTREPLFIPAGKDHLTEKNVRSIRWHEINNSLLVIYKSRAGSGFSECSLDFENKRSACKTYTKENSGLLSNYVNQIEADARGNIWLRYAENLDLGVSKLTPGGEWDNYDGHNSQIGHNSVKLIRTEKKDEGFKGDNVWFVTSSGLSRLKFIEPKKKTVKDTENDNSKGSKKINESEDDIEDEGKITIMDYDAKTPLKKKKKKKKTKINAKPEEKWIFYGDKGAASNVLYRAMGIQSWFTDAIINIVDLEVLPDSLLIATNDTVYHFKDRSILRYKANTTGGIDNKIISRLFYRNGRFFIKIRSQNDFFQVQSIEIFDMMGKKWHKLDYWHIKKTYPLHITFTPFNKTSDLVLLKYYDETLVALMDYSNYKLKLIKIKTEEKK